MEPYDAWKGELVRLRAPEPGDRPFDSESEVARNGWQIIFPPGQEAYRRLGLERSARDPVDSQEFMWAIEALDGSGVVGSISTNRADQRNGNFAYGVGLGTEFHGKGYAADALKLVCRHYFDELRYHRINALVYAFNPQSIRFHEKFGFTLEGRFREHVYTGGRYHDAFWFGMLASEFWAKYPEIRRPPPSAESPRSIP